MPNTIYSDIATKGKSRMVSDGLTDPSFVNAGLYVIQSTVDVPTNLAASDIIELTYPMQSGMAIIPQLCSVTKMGSASTSLSVKVGDSKDDDRYSTAIDIKDAATTPVKKEFAGGADMIKPAKCEHDLPIIATVTAASGVAAGTKLVFTLVTAAI